MSAGAVGAAIDFVGAGVEFGESFVTAKDIRAKGRYEQAIQEINAKMGDFMSEQAIQDGEQQVQEYAEQARILKGEAKAKLGAQGVAVNRGSALDIQDAHDIVAAKDKAKIRINAAREAFGHRISALGFRFEGKIAKLAATERGRLTVLTSGQNFLGGAAGAGAKFGRSGGFESDTPFSPGRDTEGDFHAGGSGFDSDDLEIEGADFTEG